MSKQIVRLDQPADFALEVDSWGRLVLIDPAGNRFVGVEPVRAFPLTEPERWISLVDADGKERALIEEPALLPDSLRMVLTEEIAKREFLPVITRIEKVEGEPPLCFLSVVTDRGPVRFTVEGEELVRRVGNNRVVIVDQRGQRYMVPDMNRLDPRSRALLDLFL
jgi:hypothetical protein